MFFMLCGKSLKLLGLRRISEYMNVELHCHTFYSRGTKIRFDGVDSPKAVLAAARARGIGAIAITDHNVIEGWQYARRHKLDEKTGVLVVPAEEVSTADGHMIALGITERVPPGLGVEETIDIVHDQGGLTIGVHPFDIKGDGMKNKALLCDLVEIFNAINIDRHSNNKIARLAQLHKKRAVAGSDAHSAAMIGHGLMSIDGETVDDLLASLRRGAFRIERTKYHSIITMKDLSTRRLIMSSDHVFKYIATNYSGMKKILSNKMLSFTVRSNGNHPFITALSYFSLGCIFAYSTTRQLFNP